MMDRKNCTGTGSPTPRGPIKLANEENTVWVPICPQKYIKDDVVDLAKSMRMMNNKLTYSEQLGMPNEYREAMIFYKLKLDEKAEDQRLRTQDQQ